MNAWWNTKIDIEIIGAWVDGYEFRSMSLAEQKLVQPVTRDIPTLLDCPPRAHLVVGMETILMSFDPASIDPVRFLHVVGAVLPALIADKEHCDDVNNDGICIFILEGSEVIERVELFMGRSV